mgnify:CR=1 FL=1|jgi:hypothetical protein
MRKKMKDVVNLLSDKASLKQDVFGITKQVFGQIKEMTKTITQKIKASPQVDTDKVHVEFEELNEFEFQLKVGGDIVVFLMKTNVFALPANHKDYNHKYFKSDWKKGYFGQIMIYDFIADSVKFNRVDDVGYLIERVFVNIEEHFMVEGLKNIGYTYPDISRNIITPEVLEDLIEDAILVSIETDLVSTSFADNFNLTIEQRRIKRGKMAGSKLGFQMATNKEL